MLLLLGAVVLQFASIVHAIESIRVACSIESLFNYFSGVSVPGRNILKFLR